MRCCTTQFTSLSYKEIVIDKCDQQEGILSFSANSKKEFIGLHTQHFFTTAVLLIFS
jgi:hypothetical protein